MSWDAVLTGALAAELNALLGGARVRSLLLDRTGRTLVLYLRESTLEIRFEGAEIAVGVQEAMEPPGQARPLPARIRGVDSLPDDRVLRIHLQRLRGSIEHPILIVELTGTRGNAILMGRETGRILGSLFRREGSRAIAPGQLFVPLPPSERPGLDGTVPEILDDLPSEEGQRRARLKGLAWTSSLNLDALVGSPDPRALWTHLAAAGLQGQAETRTEGVMEPGLLTVDGRPLAYPIPLPGGEWNPCASLLEALAALPGDDAGGQYLPAMVRSRLEGDLKAALKTLKALEREAAGLQDPQSLRTRADLLLARLREVRRGQAQVLLQDFEGGEVVIQLDPRLEPADNARKLYDAATKAERALKEMPRRLERARRAVAAAEARMAAALAGELPAGEAEARPGRRKGQDPGEKVPYRSYRTSGGLEVRVGLGPRKNDDLTFRHSRPMDVWLHARDVPGAHVILRWDREEKPPARDLEEAATLAALHSKARTSGSVPVDWTRRKHVRKPRKAPPGSVLPSMLQTVFVEPDPGLLERLAPED